MSSQKHIQDELRSLGSGLPISNSHAFQVPDGYFDGLAASILAKIKSMEGTVQSELEELSPLLASISKRTPYSVPSSYFEENMVSGPLHQEAESSILAVIGKTIPYTAPRGYFEALPEQVLKTVRPKARVVPLFARTWMRVASAAAVIGALFFGGYQLLSSNNNAGTGTADVPKTTTEQVASSNGQPIRKEIKQVSTKELEEFIETVQVASVRPKAVSEKPKGSEKLKVEDLLKDVSTSEMESFLSAIPTFDDELILTN